MRLARFLLFLTLVIPLASASTIRAEGWSLRDLSPFGPRAKTKAVAKQNKQPSAVQRLGSGAKRVVTGAADLVTFKWLSQDKNKKPTRTDHYRRVSRAKRNEKPKGSLLDYIFPPKKLPPPKTVEEWMSQRRMDP